MEITFIVRRGLDTVWINFNRRNEMIDKKEIRMFALGFALGIVATTAAQVLFG